MRKANPEVYGKACALYEAVGADPKNSEKHMADFLRLMDEYDFDNEIIHGPDGKVGLALCTGEVVIPAIYDSLKYMTSLGIPKEEVKAIGVRDDVECVIDYKGHEFFVAQEIEPGLGLLVPFTFRLGDTWGVGSSGGRIVIPAVMDKIEFGGNGYVFFQKAGKWGLLTPFYSLIPPRFDNIDWDEKDILVVTLDGVEGYIDERDQFTTDRDEAFYSYDIVF